jgi:bifunctional non-homologous end joining protein LigD
VPPSPVPALARFAGGLSPADLCHPTPGGRPFTAEGWLFELKHDGFRAFVRKSGSDVHLRSRWGRSMANAFPEVIDALANIDDDVVLDAELVIADDQGRSDFGELRRRALLQRPRAIDVAARRMPASLVVFDVLCADGGDLRPHPLFERKDWLQRNLSPTPRVRAVDYVPTHGQALFAVIAEHDCEGIVAKRLDAPYRAGRQSTWQKIKNAAYSRREALVWRE